MVNPVNRDPPNNPNESTPKFRMVADHVANKMHAERQAYLNTANDGSNSPCLFRRALTAIGQPLLRTLRTVRAVGSHTVLRARGARSGKVVPVTSAPRSLSQSPIRSVMHSASQSPLRSPFRSPAVSPRSDSLSDVSSLTMSPTPRDGMTTPMQQRRPPLVPVVRSYTGFQSPRGVRSPGEEKSDTPPASPRALTQTRPALSLDESALHVPSFTADDLPFRAAVRAMAQGLHQSSRSSSVSSPWTLSTASSALSSPFRLLDEYDFPISSMGSIANSHESSEDQSSVGSPPREQSDSQAWWENPDLVQEPEDMDTGCYCGLDLLVSRLVWGEPPDEHPTE